MRRYTNQQTMFSHCINNSQLKITIKNINHEMRIFFSTPIIVHLCILNLLIKLRKLSIKESKYFK